jgi:hypothetical protein
MLDAFKAVLPGWAIALIVLVLSAVVAGVAAWETSGTVGAVIVAVAAAILGPGLIGAKALTSSNPTPPTTPAVPS